MAEYLASRFGPQTAELRIPLPINGASRGEVQVFFAIDDAEAARIVELRTARRFADLADFEQRVGFLKKDLGAYRRLLDFGGDR